MKTISLWQPHAAAIARHLKTIETRHWSPPEKYIGVTIAIHAARRKIRPSELQEFQHDMAAWDWLLCPGVVQQLPYGALIATCKIERVLPTNDPVLIKLAFDQDQLPFGNFGPQRFGWILSDVKALATPVPFKGRQGWFDVPDELLLEVA